MFLIVSIKTINTERAIGVPDGIRCENILEVLEIHPNIINLVQRGSLIDILTIKWLLLVKIYGNIPKVFLKRVIKKILIIMSKFFMFWGENSAVISLVTKEIIISNDLFSRDLIIQILLLKYIIGIKNLSQLLVNISEEFGSKIENRLFIILIYSF